MLLDSNIIIYSAQPEHAQLRELIAEYAPAVSALSYLEVLGYHLLTDQQRQIPLYVYDVEDFELDLKNLRELGRL